MRHQGVKVASFSMASASCVALATVLVSPYRLDSQHQNQPDRAAEAQQGTHHETGKSPPPALTQKTATNEHKNYPNSGGADGQEKKMDLIALMTAVFTGGALVVYSIQAALMRQTLIISNSPYVNVIEIIRTPLRTESEGPITHWRFAAKLENVGNGPLRRATMTTSSRLSDTRIDEKTFIYHNESVDGNIFISPVFLGPKSAIPGTKIAVSIDELSSVGPKKKAFYIWGWVDYSDGFLFSKRRRTEFAFEIAVRADPLDPTSEPFHMPRLWHHNGADEDSFRKPVSYEAALRGELGPIRKRYRQAASKPRRSQGL